MDENLRMVF